MTQELPPLPAPFGTIDIYEDSGRTRSVDGFTTDQMRGFALDYANLLARTASTRTASNTRTAALQEAARLCDAADKSEHPSDLADRIRALAAGEAECDAARSAAPASQHDASNRALRSLPEYARVREEFGLAVTMGARFDINSAMLNVDSLMSAISSDTRRIDFMESNPELRLSYHKRKWALIGFTNYEYEADKTLRAAIDRARAALATAEQSEAAGPACQGGNTKQDALQELATIAQANNMGYGPPSVDVEAERPAFEKEANAARFFPAEIDFTRAKSPSGRDEYANSHLQSRWEGWLAKARTQADAGKDEPQLYCPKCHIDRLKQPCGSLHGCALAGITQLAALASLAATKPENT